MNKVYYYWYSAKQRHDKFGRTVGNCSYDHNGRITYNPPLKNFALINGKVVEYTTCSETDKHDCMWDDMKFLGTGTYDHSEKL